MHCQQIICMYMYMCMHVRTCICIMSAFSPGPFSRADLHTSLLTEWVGVVRAELVAMPNICGNLKNITGGNPIIKSQAKRQYTAAGNVKQIHQGLRPAIENSIEKRKIA